MIEINTVREYILNMASDKEGIDRQSIFKVIGKNGIEFVIGMHELLILVGIKATMNYYDAPGYNTDKLIKAMKLVVPEVKHEDALHLIFEL
ncbi:hypothetical protein PP747_gp004 [Rhizobium phage RHph_Y38]|uniref:Uncharacterized protein n=1 Tax=Rhizobium phage RHph_Y38 TaxID=2509781 RepID=A0A7S5R4D6_9CAUD|nr:hypothetical protein PP747_gp004 [Rhizobium phage RHph_Y38]QIG67705.1 hypothetical protein EVB52_004 [Rhizobium phage RHph_Y38]